MSGTASSSFDVVLSDDFSNGYKVENWGYAFNGGTYWNGAFTWSNSDVAVRDGTMQVTQTRHSDGSWTTGGFNSFKADKTITYGKIEFDGKVEESQGTMGVFLTWPKSDSWPIDGEIDILETPGQDVMHTTHWEDGSGDHQYSSVRNQSYDETQWNHYELLWLPDYMSIRVNGNLVAEWTDPDHIPDVAHGIGAMGMVGAPGEAWIGGGPDGSTPDVTTTYMDNVVMSQWNGGPVDKTGGAVVVPPPEPVFITAGSGSDSLVLKISQDAYQGPAQYTVSVDGVQVGGTFTASAWHSAGQSDTLTLKGDWAAGAHQVSVNFLNDAWGGSASTDRNLHVDGATYNGQAVAGAAASLETTGAKGFAFTEAAPVTSDPVVLTAGTGTDALVLKISQDAYQGSAQYTVFVDGVQVGGTFTASASHAAGQSDTLTLKGNWAAGAHQVSVEFLNDAYGGSAATDRNLHVDAATYNGQAVAGAAASLMSAGAKGFSFTEAAAPTAPDPVSITAGSGPDALVLKISQDAYQGSAQYTVSVDGVQVGGAFTASAWHSAGQSDTLTLKGDWAAGAHQVEVRFLNDAWGGSASTDRNLHVDGATYNGAAVTGAAATFKTAGAKGFAFAEAAPPVVQAGTAAADLFDATGAGGVFTGGGGRDLFVFEAGDGPVTVTDFASRTDKLVFIDLEPEDVGTAAADQDGTAGLLVSYGDAGAVFLAGVTGLAAKDMVFA